MLPCHVGLTPTRTCPALVPCPAIDCWPVPCLTPTRPCPALVLCPAADCWSMPYLIHVFVAVISLIVFVIMAAGSTMGEMDLNPTSRNLMAMAHSK